MCVKIVILYKRCNQEGELYHSNRSVTILCVELELVIYFCMKLRDYGEYGYAWQLIRSN